MRLGAITIYPVKSCAPQPLTESALEPWGLQHDRRWMLATPDGRFLTQRDCPTMALIRADPEPDAILLHLPTGNRIAARPNPTATVRATIWRDEVPAHDAGDTAAAHLSAFLGRPCRLLHLADPRSRRIDPDYGQPTDRVSLADGFPLLLATTASLADLNTRLPNPVPMARFRPNLVIEATAPWEEDEWRRLAIGEAIFRVAKPCARCLITTIDQATGTIQDKREPLRTLARFRRQPGGVMFGQNLIPERLAPLRVGDPVRLL